MEKNESTRKREDSIRRICVITLTIAVICLTVVYIAMSRTIKIINNDRINDGNGNWNIHFENLSNAKISGSASVISAPKLSYESTSINDLEVNFVEKNDSVTYTFDVVNKGNIDAKMENIISSNLVCDSVNNNLNDENMVCKNVKYTLTYTNSNKKVDMGDYLNKKERKNLTLKIFYEGDMPTSTVEISSFNISLIYVEK